MEMSYEEIAEVSARDREMEIPVTGLYGMKFIIVKIRSNKYVLYFGERQTQRGFVGVFKTLDDTYDAISRKCKKEKCDKCQTRLIVEPNH